LLSNLSIVVLIWPTLSYILYSCRGLYKEEGINQEQPVKRVWLLNKIMRTSPFLRRIDFSTRLNSLNALFAPSTLGLIFEYFYFPDLKEGMPKLKILSKVWKITLKSIY